MATDKVIPINGGHAADLWAAHYARHIDQARAREQQCYCMGCFGTRKKGCECWCGCGAPIGDGECHLHEHPTTTDDAQAAYAAYADKIAIFALMLLWLISAKGGL